MQIFDRFVCLHGPAVSFILNIIFGRVVGPFWRPVYQLYGWSDTSFACLA